MKKLFLLASLALSLNTIAQVPSYVPTNGLKGWWPFTGNANDESGNGNNGTVNGATLTSDRFGNVNSAYSFDGTNDFINVPEDSTMELNQHTISFWFNSPILPNSRFDLIGKDNTTGNRQYVIQLESSGVIRNAVFTDIQPYIIDGNTIITTNNWINVVVTWDGIINRTYINSNLDTSISTLGNLLQDNWDLFLGGTPSFNQYYFGKLDDIGFWNRALTQQEITALYNGCNTCATPTNIAVASITGSKATISWTGNSCAAKYRVRYRVQGTTSWVTKIVTAPVSSKILTLLQPLTTYEYQVRTDCNATGTVASAYSNIQTFTTICDCIKPTNLSVSNLTQTTATVSWVGNACAVKYRVQYRVQGTTTWTTKVVTAPTVTKTLTGLTANTIYEYRLRTDCNSTGTVNSGWTTTATITTTLKLEETEISSSTFYVSPNPCSTCFVSGAENESDLIVTDIVGRIVSVEYTKSENGFYINMPDASNGLYLIRNNRTGEVVKFVKE